MNEAWTRLRAMRSGPPGLAKADADRRAVFGAALAQSEELFRAACVVSPASKPLPLFYGLSQAGRAIAAAHKPGPSWSIAGHGLAVRSEGPDLRQTVVAVRPKKDLGDAYASVCVATGASPLAGEVTLSELVAALPELDGLLRLRGNALPTVAIDTAPSPSPSPMLLALAQPANGSAHLIDLAPGETVNDRLARYARTDGVEVMPGDMPVVGGITSVAVNWPAKPSESASRGARAVRAMSEVAVLVSGRWYLQPLVGDPPGSSSLLMTWWPLLIALSSLARYEPAVWTAALDVDHSALAVELEQMLLIAEDRLPELLVRALAHSFSGVSEDSDG